MRIKAYVLVVSAALCSISAGTKKAKPTVGFNPGDMAPRIEFFEEGNDFSFSNHSGRYTLVNFWAVYDGESRMRNVKLSNEVKKLNPSKIVMYSVSLDEKESVFNASIKADRLQESNQLHFGLCKQSKIFDEFKLEKGLRNFLINDKGMIVASNVKPGDLESIMK